jgi:hypothetical protein
MNCFPFRAERANDVLHPANEGSDVGFRKTVILAHVRRAAWALQVENGMIGSTHDRHVCRPMVVGIDHDARGADAENRWHVPTVSIESL